MVGIPIINLNSNFPIISRYLVYVQRDVYGDTVWSIFHLYNNKLTSNEEDKLSQINAAMVTYENVTRGNQYRTGKTPKFL